ncbi:RNase A-like domain-containing protein [Streptomyces variegatus]|uniref:RNase A-like domain-containing protein n=1 Tax=Streptomyces variegatus TaxID=284040 RepID=UPI003C2FF2EB
MLTRSASYPDRETAHWATQQVVTANEQVIHRWLAQGTRARLTIEAAWPSREDPVGRVQLEGDLLAGRGPVHASRCPTAPGSGRWR